MTTILWILQALLAALLLLAGIAKATRSKENLLELERMKWVEDLSAANLRGIGTLEILAGIGLTLPPLLGILPWRPSRGLEDSKA